MKLIRIAIVALLSFLFLSLAVQPHSIAYADGADVNYWAVIVGVADYPGVYNDLYYTANGVMNLSDRLAPIWGEDHIKLLLNSEATKLNIKDAICSWLNERADTDDVVLFCYAGHGLANYLCPYDTLARSYGNDISTGELDGWLSNLKSKNIAVVLETCYSGSFIGPLSKTGRVILTSSSSDESSWEIIKLKAGVFTNYLLDAIDHYADADINRDHELSFEEIFAYASPKVSSYMEENFYIDQSPQIIDGSEGNLGLFYWSTIDISPHSTYLTMVIDGHEYSCTKLPVSFKWVPDSVHSVGINSSSSDWISMPSQTISQGGEYNLDYLTVKSDYGNPQGDGWYFEGTTASISITSPQGIIIRDVFTGWSGDSTATTSNATILMDGSKTVTARWHKDYTQLYILIAGLLGIAVVVAIFVRFIFIKKRRLSRVQYQ